MTEAPLRMDFKLNVISLANLIALIGILVTAISTWYGLAGDVRIATSDIGEIRAQLNQSLIERKAELEALRAKDEMLMDTIRGVQSDTSEKLHGIDVKVQILQNSTVRVEQTLKELLERKNGHKDPG